MDPPAGGGDEPATPAPAPEGAGDQEPSRPRREPDSRRRYGRRRGGIPAGDAFVARLGPARDEPFVSIDDDDDLDQRFPRPLPDTPIGAIRFVALDCETTGQAPDRLLELGAVAFTLDRHLHSLETLVHTNDRINPWARRIHGISSETLAGAPQAEQVLRRFASFARGAVLVEHSADAFDTRLIAGAIPGGLNADNIDTSRLARTLWDLRDTIGLERLCNELGVRHRRPHHALADAEATAACFLALVEQGRERLGWETLGDLLGAGQPPPPRTEPRPRRRPPRANT